MNSSNEPVRKARLGKVTLLFVVCVRVCRYACLHACACVYGDQSSLFFLREPLWF